MYVNMRIVVRHSIALRRPITATESTALAETFKALSDPARLQLFVAVADNHEPLCVCDLPDVGIAQPTVSTI